MKFRPIDPFLLLLMWACFALLARNAYAADGTVLSEPVLLALIAAVTSTIASALTLVVTIINNKKVTAVANKVELVEKNTNSMKDALIAATKSEALMVGQAQGKAEEKTKQTDLSEAHAAGRAEGKAASIAEPHTEVNPQPVKVIATVPVPVTVTNEDPKP